MIEFDCQHCGKRFAVHDDLAGREGWCRSCKKMIVVPHPSGVRFIEDMPPEERFTRMHRLLMIAASKAEKYKNRVKELEAQEFDHHSTPPPQFELESENAHFEERINELEHLLSVLTDQHETDLEVQSDQAQKLEEMTKENAKLQLRLSEQDPLHDQVTDLERKLHLTSEESKVLAAELTSVQLKNLELLSLLDQIQGDKEENLSTSEAEIIKLQSELSSLQEQLLQRDNALHAFHNNEMEWKSNTESAQEILHEVEGHLKKAQSENTQLQDSVKALQDEIASLKNDKNHIEIKFSTVSAENLQLHADLEKLKLENNSQRMEFDNENEQLKEKITILENDLKVLRSNTTESKLKQIISKLEKEHAEKNNEITELYIDVDRKRIEIQDVQAAQSNTEMLLNNSDMMLKDYNVELSELRDKLEAEIASHNETKDALKVQQELLENTRRLNAETSTSQLSDVNVQESNISELNNGYVEIVDNEDSIQNQIHYMGSDALIQVVQQMQEDEQREMMSYLQRFIDQKR